MLTLQMTIQPGRVLMVSVTLATLAAVVALLGACGGNEEALLQEVATQQQREAAALKRAHDLNADAMGKIKHERAMRQAQSN